MLPERYVEVFAQSSLPECDWRVAPTYRNTGDYNKTASPNCLCGVRGVLDLEGCLKVKVGCCYGISSFLD